MFELLGIAIPSFIFLFIFLLIPIAFLLFNILTSIWAYRDSIRKGKSKEYALVVLVLTLIFPVIGLIVYLVIRND